MSDRIAVGRLAGVFGVKGWLKVRSNTSPEENIINYKPWWLKTPHGLKQVEIDEYAFRPQGLIVHIQGYDDRDLAGALGKAVIEVEKSQLPKLGKDKFGQEEFYWHQLIGLQVYTLFGQNNDSGILLGKVSDLLETGANDVIVVKPCAASLDDKERLVPYIPGQFVMGVNLGESVMQVDWDPEF